MAQIGRRALAVLAPAALLVACAEDVGHPAAATAAASQCFYPSEVSGWRAAGDKTVYLRVGVNRVYRMDLMAPCPDIDGRERIGIEHRGSPTICSGLDATIVARSSIGPQRCPVTSLQELSPAEIAALSPADRP